ncbi:MAG: ABC transporter permease [Bacteroidales bacterium]|nr:ABC transporter permease [Bacteroidales bacterium]
MFPLDTIKLALRALMRNRTRTFLTMLGIIIGISSVIIMMSLGSSLTHYMDNVFSSIGTNVINVRDKWVRDGGTWRVLHSTDEADYLALHDNCQSVKYISPDLSTSTPIVFGNNNHNAIITGGNEYYLKLNGMSVARGSMFDESDVRSLAKVCLIGQTVVEKLFPDGQEPIGQTIRCGNVPLIVIGTLQAREKQFNYDFNNLVITPYTTLQKRLLGRTDIDQISIAATSDNDRTVEEVRQILRIYHGLQPDDEDDFEIEVQSETMDQLSSVLNIVVLILSLIAGISLIVGGVGIMNIMYVTVTERTREIGLRKALGARRSNILTQFLSESVVLSLAGGLIGIFSGLSIYAIASAFIEQLPFVLNGTAILISFGVCTVVGIFFGWYPARKAANLDPIQALRYE